MVSNRLVQKYTTIYGREFVRFWNSSDGAYGAWNEIGAAPPNASTSTRGLVQLSSELNNNSTSLSATPNAVRQKLTYNRSNLGTRSLNTITDEATQSGVYYQTTSGNATAGRGYPVAEAGTLIAVGAIGGWLTQTYIAMVSGRMFTRRRTSSNDDTWQDWKEINQNVPPGAIIAFAKRGDGSAPPGYIVCNGGAFNRTTYAALFGVIGTRYGNGNGDTTFNVPDIDAGMALLANNGNSSFAIKQSGAVKRHNHTATTALAGEHHHPKSTTNEAGRHNHPKSTTTKAGIHSHPNSTYLEDDRGSTNNLCRTTRQRGGEVFINTEPSGEHQHNLTIVNDGLHSHTLDISDDGEHRHTVTVANTGGDNNLAAGVSFLMCIKF